MFQDRGKEGKVSEEEGVGTEEGWEGDTERDEDEEKEREKWKGLELQPLPQPEILALPLYRWPFN